MITYASADDLASWLGDRGVAMPDLPTLYLSPASMLVARAVNENPYDVSTVITQPKTDATCAQVTAWLTTGVTPGTAGLSTSTDQALKKVVKVDTAEVQYDTALSTSSSALAARAELLDSLCPEAEAILLQAGVLWQALATVTSDPVYPYGHNYRPMYGDGFGWDRAFGSEWFPLEWWNS